MKNGAKLIWNGVAKQLQRSF